MWNTTKFRCGIFLDVVVPVIVSRRDLIRILPQCPKKGGGRDRKLIQYVRSNTTGMAIMTSYNKDILCHN
jgi:hypothetical protein